MSFILLASTAQVVNAENQWNRFKDLKGSEWFISEVNVAVDRQYVQGYADKTFRPENKIKVSEAYKMFLVMMECDLGGVENGNAWYKPVQDKAIELDLVSKDTDFSKDISRKQTFELISKITGKSVKELQQSGVIKGKTDGNLDEESTLTRAELVTLVNRVADFDKQLGKDNLNNMYDVRSALKPFGEVKQSSPRTVNEFKAEITDMILKGETTRKFTYPSDMSFNELFTNNGIAYKEMYGKHPEVVSVVKKIYVKGKLPASTHQSLELSIVFPETRYLTKEDDLVKLVEKELDAFIASTNLGTNPSQKDIARELYKYVISELEYDREYSDKSYTLIGALEDRKATCQGYTSMYNLMLRSLGIEAEGQVGIANGGNHIWTRAILDGQPSWIDTTFGDPVPDKGKGRYNIKYFDIEESELRKSHNW